MGRGEFTYSCISPATAMPSSFLLVWLLTVDGRTYCRAEDTSLPNLASQMNVVARGKQRPLQLLSFPLPLLSCTRLTWQPQITWALHLGCRRGRFVSGNRTLSSLSRQDRDRPNNSHGVSLHIVARSRVHTTYARPGRPCTTFSSIESAQGRRNIDLSAPWLSRVP
jgi:hypothetical protein